MGVLGFLLVWLGFRAGDGGLTVQALLVGLGVLVLSRLPQLRRSASKSIILTETRLIDSEDAVICEIGDIASVERGTFAFRPTNGFMIRIKTSSPFAWHPGMWWRIGKRLGVGGILNASQTKLMADMLSAQMHRDNQQE